MSSRFSRRMCSSMDGCWMDGMPSGAFIPKRTGIMVTSFRRPFPHQNIFHLPRAPTRCLPSIFFPWAITAKAAWTDASGDPSRRRTLSAGRYSYIGHSATDLDWWTEVGFWLTANHTIYVQPQGFSLCTTSHNIDYV